MKYVEYLQTDGTLIMWDTGVKVFQNGDNVTLDFMPFSGNPSSSPYNPFLNDFSNGDYSGCNVAIRHFSRYNENSTELYFADNSFKQVPFVSGTKYNIFMDSGGMYVDGVKVNTLAAVNFASENSVDTIKVNAEVFNGQMRRSPIARYYEVKVGSSNGLKADLKPCLDNNNVPCFYDEVSQTFIYHTGVGNAPIAGPIMSTLFVSADKTKVPASGGTINVTIDSETSWTASTTANWFTMSSTSGTSADTAITITVPSTTSVTQVEETILFTNATGDTDSLTIKQSKYSSGGTNNLFVGTENVEGMMIGGQSVEAIYLGTEVVYSPGPFVGLKVKPSEINFAKESGLTYSLKIKSSEAWTLALPNDATWLSASTLSGVSGETTVTLSTTEENTGDTRTAVITATTASFSATCTVNQNVVHYVSWIFTTNPTNNSDYRDGIEIGNVWSADAEFRIKGTMQGYSTGKGVLTNYQGSVDVPTRWFWVGGNMYYDFGGSRIQKSYQPTSGVDFDYTISNWAVYDNLTSEYFMSGTPKSSIEAGVVLLNMRTCKISSIEVKQGNTVVFDGKAAIDDSTGNIGLYDSVSETFFYNSNLSMTYGE